MSHNSENYNIAAMRSLLKDAFTADSLWRFCQERADFRPVLYEVGRNAGIAEMIDVLLERCRTHLLFEKLIAAVREANPVQYEQYKAQLYAGEAAPLPVPHVPHNLPPRVEFIGRGREKARIHEALQSRYFLVSIEGIGGIGKTSLALEVAYECLNASQSSDPPDGLVTFDSYVWASATDRDLDLNALLDAIALTLDYPSIVQRRLEHKLFSVQKLLRDRACLLLVDNFETVTDTQVREFLSRLPEPSKALITTREQKLNHTWSISLKGLEEREALALIRCEGALLELESIQHADERTLLRLHAATGGAPLAIKWAVGQIKQRGQSLDTVLAALHEARGSIFEQIFARSWDLLSEHARQVLLVMPLFATSAAREPIEAVSGLHHFALDEAIGQLVEMSVLNADIDSSLLQARYSTHPLTRQFAKQRLSVENRNAACSRFVDHFATLSKHLGWVPPVTDESKQPEWPIPPHVALYHLNELCHLIPDIPNMRVALEAARGANRWGEMRDILMIHVALLWQTGAHEERTRVEDEYGPLLDRNGMPEARAWLRIENLSSYLVQGKEQEATGTIEHLSALLDTFHDQELKAYVDWFRARLYDQRALREKPDERNSSLMEAERILITRFARLLGSIAEEERDPELTEYAEYLLEKLAEQHGAIPACEYARLCEIEINNHVGSWCELICTLADVLVHQNRLDEAELWYRRRIELADRDEYRTSDLLPWVHVRLGRLYYKQHDLVKAREHCELAEALLDEQATRAGIEATNDPIARAHMHYWLAQTEGACRNRGAALQDAQKSLEFFEQQQAIPMATKVRKLIEQLVVLPEIEPGS